MKRTWIACLALVLLSGWTAAQQPSDPPAAKSAYKTGHGSYTVTTKDEDWRDDARKRTLPVRIYVPKAKAGDAAKFPVIVFSHGWGASRASYGYICDYLASRGYLVIAPTHPGSDTASIPLGRGGGAGQGTEEDRRAKLRERLLGGGKDGKNEEGKKEGEKPKDTAKDEAPKQESLMESIIDPENLRNRPRDISFVIDQLDKQATTRDLADLKRVGVAGHSFGAYTAMAIGGMTVQVENKKGSFRDDRVKAVLPMSPEGHGTMGIEAGAWDHFACPVLFLTGTQDYGQGAKPAAWRREAFEAISGVDDYLLTLDGAGHLTFAFPMGKAEVIESVTTAFFDAYVKDDAAAKAWLTTYFMAKHGDGVGEFKPGKK